MLHPSESFGAGGKFSGVAFLCALIHPCRDSLNLLLSQSSIICPFTSVRVCVPGGHLAINDLLFDGPRPGTHIIIRKHREWRGL